MKVDLRPQLPPIRDQGSRPTCISFAASDAHAAQHNPAIPFSVEYLHYHATKLEKKSLDKGVGPGTVRTALSKEGQPHEAKCPYCLAQVNSWKPDVANPIWRADSHTNGATLSKYALSCISKGSPVVLSFRMIRSFYRPPSTHIIRDDNSKAVANHAMLLVAADDSGTELLFLARNSWGVGWADAGHVWLPASFVDARGYDAFHIVGSTKSDP